MNPVYAASCCHVLGAAFEHGIICLCNPALHCAYKCSRIPLLIFHADAMTYTSLFSAFPRTARLWIHVARHPVPAASQQGMRDALTSFASSWDSHGQPVSADVAWCNDRFLFVAAHVDAAGASVSGCATDALVHAVSEAAQQHEVEWAPALSVPYRTAEGAVAVADRAAFATLARAGTVDATTLVFDPSLSTLGPLRDGAFEQPAATTWHARAFPLARPA